MLFHCLQSIQSNKGLTIFGLFNVGMLHIISSSSSSLGLFFGHVQMTLTKHFVAFPCANLLLNAALTNGGSIFEGSIFRELLKLCSDMRRVCCGMSWYVPEAFQNELCHTYLPQAHACQRAFVLTRLPGKVWRMFKQTSTRLWIILQCMQQQLNQHFDCGSCKVYTSEKQAVVSMSIQRLNISLQKKKNLINRD